MTPYQIFCSNVQLWPYTILYAELAGMLRLRVSTVVCSSLFDICMLRACNTCRTQTLTVVTVLIFVQNLSPLHEAAEGADFSKHDPDPVGVAGGVTKIKVAYNLILLTGIPAVSMTCACHASLSLRALRRAAAAGLFCNAAATADKNASARRRRRFRSRRADVKVSHPISFSGEHLHAAYNL